LILIIAFVEFTTGVVRNAIMQWYFIFAAEVKQPGAEFFLKHWGLLLCITGIIGGFAAGLLSDKVFHSRRGPPVALAGMAMFVTAIVMSLTLMNSPIVVGVCAVLLCLLSISVHALMSGTAASDFGGRKATATASGITDGFVYLGSGLQSVSLGYLTTQSWHYWPVFVIPFILIGIALSLRMWRALPEATRQYLLQVEKVRIAVDGDGVKMETVEVTETL
jgi:OPA family glycerol-3-phosphate transporter-like MFS transporter